MISSKRLLIIGAGVNQLPLIARAKSMGLHVTALDGNPDAPGLRLADCPHVVNTRDQKAAVLIARENGVDGVVSIASDLALPTLAAVAEDLGLAGITRASAEVATHKGKMRERLRAAGIPCPEFGRATSLDLARTVVGRIGYPVIVKPVDRAGGYGSTKVLGANEFEIAFHKAKATSFVEEVIVEELMVGAQISLDFVVFRHRTTFLGLSDTVYSHPPVAVELRHIMPSALPLDVKEECRRLAMRAIEALKIDNCAGFVEIMAMESGCKIIEIAGRLSGLAENLVQVATGIDVTKAVIDIALGVEPDVKPVREVAVAQLYIHPGRAGSIESIAGFESAREVPGIQYINLWLKEGDRVEQLSDNHNRIGRLAAVGQTSSQALERAERALSLLRFKINSESPAHSSSIA